MGTEVWRTVVRISAPGWPPLRLGSTAEPSRPMLGALLLGGIEAGSGLMAKMAACFDDHRDPEKIEHTVEALLKQRVFALALGYEDLNDPINSGPIRCWRCSWKGRSDRPGSGGSA